jgi:uncharacterized protein (DUF2252 family)
MHRLALAILPSLLLIACQSAQDAEDARRRWLQDALVADNRDLMERDPDATAQKLLKMASSPYTYYRGTAALFWRDQLQPGATGAPTRFLSPAAARVRLLGDPHPENLGTMRAPDGRMALDFNDLDASTWGPYHVDVRRLAMGFGLIGAMAPAHIDAAGEVELVHAVAAAYADEIARIAAEQPTAPLIYAAGEGAADPRVIIADLLRRAERDGAAREELDDYTELDAAGHRRLRRAVIEPPSDDGVIHDQLIEPTPAQLAALTASWPAYLPTTTVPTPAAHLAIKDVAMRLGAGVSSYPLPRYYVLVEGPTASPDDDLILEARECRDSVELAGLNRPALRRFPHNAARIVDAQRALNALPQADPLLGWTALDTWSLRVRERSKYQKGVDVTRIIERLDDATWRLEDVLALASASGRLLAQAHARGQTLDGDAGIHVISPLITPDPAGFIEETTRAAMDALGLLLDDHERLRRIIATDGPLLGWRPAPTAPR